MSRTEVLREVRKMRFLEVYEKSRDGRLSYCEAAETLGLSERQFRRLRGRFEVEGEAGLLDRRVGKLSVHRSGRGRADRVALPGSLCRMDGAALLRPSAGAA
jgi:hypothetical protein